MKYTDKIYGDVEIDGVFLALYNTSVFQRLKRIHQGGPVFLANPVMNHTRLDHSMGVMLLIRRLGGSTKEQIAGLLHDISHTTFSHLIDYVLQYENEDYHETRYANTLNNNELQSILALFNLRSETFFELERFPILEYPLPSLSADRIDYTLRDLFQLGLITKKEIEWFLNDLVVKSGRIFVLHVECAKWFKKWYSYLVDEYFHGFENKSSACFMKSIVSQYYHEGYLTIEDFHEDDFYLMAKIEKRSKKKLGTMFEEWKKEYNSFESIKMKERKIDPEIIINDSTIRLSQWNI